MGVGKKLKPHQVREIRALYANHQASRKAGVTVSYTLPEIGKMYGVSYVSVWHVGMRNTFIDLPDEPDDPNEGRYPKQPTKDMLRKRKARSDAA